MTRVEGHFDSVVQWALKIGLHPAHLPYRVVRCEHGKTGRQMCKACEAGMMQDMNPYALLPNVAHDPDGVQLAAVVGDGEGVIYIPARYQYKIKG